MVVASEELRMRARSKHATLWRDQRPAVHRGQNARLVILGVEPSARGHREEVEGHARCNDLGKVESML